MNRLNIIFAFLAAIIFASCDDYVDIQPKGKAIVETVEHVNDLLEYGINYSGIEAVSNQITLISDNIEMSQDELDLADQKASTQHYVSIYKLEKIFFDLSRNDELWDKPYKAIANCNFIINVLPEVAGDTVLKKQYEAEALTHRAFAYWSLVNMFSVHYGLTQAAEDESGVPIYKYYADQDESLVRQPVNVVYELIEKDLKKAILQLSVGRPHVDRVNKAAAQAMLARVYLHMGKYSDALKLAEDALEYNQQLTDYNEISEPLYAMQSAETVFLKERNMLYLGGWTTRKMIGTFTGELANLFVDKVNDLRISKMCTYSDGKYIYQRDNRNTRLALGITVPELLLIKAECLARDDAQWIDAVEVLNTLREKRFATGSDYELEDAETKEEAIQAVIDERRREFHVTGMRFFDMKRLNALHDANLSLTRFDVTWTANSINWAIPIGERVINTSNNQIKQNERE